MSLEIQLLADDIPAREAFDGEEAHDAPARTRLAPSLAAALSDVVRFQPLMISFDYLRSLKTSSAIGQEYFTVELRRMVPVHAPDERLEDGPQRFDIIELTCGEMEFSAMVPQDSMWPHVTVHRAWPLRHDFAAHVPPTLERAFLAALRDAVQALAMPPIL